MAAFVGATWATRGWFTTASDTADRWVCDVYPSVWSLWRAHQDATRILLNIPIGLPEPTGSRRACDEHAKRLLGERHPGVFYAPVRPAVYQHSILRAKEINEEAGFSIQNQAWSLVSRIREVDEFLDDRPGARDRCRETHAEVCYHALNAGPLRYSPTTAAGRGERMDIVRAASHDIDTSLDRAIETFTHPRYAPMVTSPMDIVDAFVAAITARREERLATLPVAPPTDARGLPMEIVYPADLKQLTLTAIEASE